MNNDKDYTDKQIYRVIINAPIDTVWSELLKTTNPRPFFWNGTWDLTGFSPNEAYRITANNGKSVAVIGKIIELDPPHKLVTSFRLTSLPDPASKVTYTLTEKDGGTEFCLITENIISGSKSEKSMADGATFIVKNFKAYLETGKVTFGAQMMLGMFNLMSGMTPKEMNIENWPFDKAD